MWTDEILLEKCIEKYVDDVYVEFGENLYRREGAPVYRISYPSDDDHGLSAIELHTPLQNLGFYRYGDEWKLLVADGKFVSDLPVEEVTE